MCSLRITGIKQLVIVLVGALCVAGLVGAATTVNWSQVNVSSAQIQTTIGAGVYDASGAAAARAGTGTCGTIPQQYETGDATGGPSCAQVAYSSLSGTPAAISVVPPYLEIGTTKYIPTDNMFAATLPPASPTFLNSSLTGLTVQTATSGSPTNGNDEFTSSGVATNWWLSATATTSVESVAVLSALGGAVSGTGYSAGPWIYDSTNGVVWALTNEFVSNTSASCPLLLWKWTCSATCPASTLPVYTASTPYAGPGCAGAGTPLHLKMVKASSTLTFYVSIDGGVFYWPLNTTESVGTIAKGGLLIASTGTTSPITVNLLSLNVQ